MYNIVIMGDYFVGKTSIITRIIQDTFDLKTYSTIGTSYFSKDIKINGNNNIIKFSIWDTGGQERFRSFITFYLKNAHIIFLCYDITNKQSFNNLHKWIKIIKENVKVNYIGVLIGTKLDLNNKRQVEKQYANNYANSIDFFFYETSSKDNINIDTLFDFTINTFIKNNMNNIKKDLNTFKSKIVLEDNKNNNYFKYC
mgnify:CR=1 FL=1|tara:strand:+ start:23 stop:616 length:594 start_codon:yes stop_codon:yes gene_type:complete